MINAVFFIKDSLLTGFEVKGHSMSAPKGEDIICSFVSSACLMTANTVTEVIGAKAEAKVDDGFLSFKTNSESESVQDIIKGLRLHLEELQKDYPENIKVTTMEV